MKSSLQPLMSSATGEHNTPLHIIKLVTEVLGTIDLDPCADAGHSVPAKQHFTELEDGLRHEWHARTLYMNPPYGRGIEVWTNKLLREFSLGHITEAIALIPARCDTVWFQTIVVRAALCEDGCDFRQSRMMHHFHRHFYLGHHEEAFINAFRVLGPIVRALRVGAVRSDYVESTA
jgi:hypothetical protein